jgi:hypothetical protein
VPGGGRYEGGELEAEALHVQPPVLLHVLPLQLTPAAAVRVPLPRGRRAGRAAPAALPPALHLSPRSLGSGDRDSAMERKAMDAMRSKSSAQRTIEAGVGCVGKQLRGFALVGAPARVAAHLYRGRSRWMRGKRGMDGGRRRRPPETIHAVHRLADGRMGVAVNPAGGVRVFVWAPRRGGSATAALPHVVMLRVRVLLSASPFFFVEKATCYPCNLYLCLT